MKRIKKVMYNLVYLFTNYIVANIPCWIIRCALYKALGMKIGAGSRINMKCTVFEPWNINIGNSSMINEYCLLDGRGGWR